VVVALVNLLPEARYHVFLDNLFSSSNLFRRLRRLGHNATGTARRNCGLYRLLVKLKLVIILLLVVFLLTALKQSQQPIT
jgi:hypothetical protein